MSKPSAGRRRRLAEELEESGLRLDVGDATSEALLDEIEFALRPPVHERRVPSSGAIVDPTTDAESWSPRTQLEITHRPIGELPLKSARLFADGLSSWLLRRTDAADEWVVFDRPAGSERDMVVLSCTFGASVVQRHPSGVVRVVGPFGVLRWLGFSWHHEPPIPNWVDVVTAASSPEESAIIEVLLEFAVHDLGSLGIGALLIYRADDEPGPEVEGRLPEPPALRVDRPSHLAPLRHALEQVDGAAVFDSTGTLRQLGVRLVPSADAEESVDAYKGTRHTSGRRYSYDDPTAIVIAVSEDGPVSVLRNGEVLGRSPRVD